MKRSPQSVLRAALGEDAILVAPGVYDAFGALLATGRRYQQED